MVGWERHGAGSEGRGAKSALPDSLIASQPASQLENSTKTHLTYCKLPRHRFVVSRRCGLEECMATLHESETRTKSTLAMTLD